MLNKLLFVPMTVDDLPLVDALEQVSFPTPWSVTTFRHELKHNPRSFYWVVRIDEAVNAPEPMPALLGYGGYWLLGDEAHIVTLATHPDWRRRGIAEWLLLRMMERAREVLAKEVTLEVRRSNVAAQGLYFKLGFEEVGVRKRYYRDNDEDALLLTLFAVDQPAVWQRLAARLHELQEKTFASPHRQLDGPQR